MRILVLAYDLPYPPTRGSDLRSWSIITALMEIGEVGVVGVQSDDASQAESPHPRLAMWRVAELMNQQEADEAPPQSRLGHPFDGCYSPNAEASLRATLREFAPEIVVIEGSFLYHYMPALRSASCHLILDSHDVEAEVYERVGDPARESTRAARLVGKMLAQRTRELEGELARAVDQIWACSERDADLIKEWYRPPGAVHVVPNAVDFDASEPVRTHRRTSGTDRSQTLLFPASFGYFPNERAAAFLIDDLFPRLAKRFPDCRLTLAGRSPTSQMLAAAEADRRIVVTGTVADIRPFFEEASVMVVPIFEGGGTRIKILEAFASGLPVVSTAKGAEGLAVRDGMHLLLAENADAFVAAVERVWGQPDLAQQLATNGATLVEERYSWPVVHERVRTAIQELNPDPTG